MSNRFACMTETMPSSPQSFIVEQGEVPILMSLPQIRNLRFHFDLHPDKAYLSSPVLGIKNMVLKVARSTHLILDLLDVCHHMWNVKFEKHKKVRFFTNGIHFEYGNIAKLAKARKPWQSMMRSWMKRRWS